MLNLVLRRTSVFSCALNRGHHARVFFWELLQTFICSVQHVLSESTIVETPISGLHQKYRFIVTCCGLHNAIPAVSGPAVGLLRQHCAPSLHSTQGASNWLEALTLMDTADRSSTEVSGFYARGRCYASIPSQRHHPCKPRSLKSCNEWPAVFVLVRRRTHMEGRSHAHLTLTAVLWLHLHPLRMIGIA